MSGHLPEQHQVWSSNPLMVEEIVERDLHRVRLVNLLMKLSQVMMKRSIVKMIVCREFQLDVSF